MNVLESLEGVGVVPSNTDTYSLKQFRDGFDIVTKTGGACEIKCAQGKFDFHARILRIRNRKK